MHEHKTNQLKITRQGVGSNTDHISAR